MTQRSATDAAVVFDPATIDLLIAELSDRGYTVLGPRVVSDAIVYGPVTSSSDLPVGIRDRQDAASYRLEDRDDDAVFGYVCGPQGWKRFLHPPETTLFTAAADGDVSFPPPADAPLAFLGVRACELAAIHVQDRVLLEGPVADPVYRSNRDRLFIVAVDCTEPGGTCFCASTGTGPAAGEGFDIAMVELLDATHRFLARAGTDLGAEVLAALPSRPARSDDQEQAGRLVAEARTAMGRSVDLDGVEELLYANAVNPHWEDIARRCLACTNCTMVCPTCFCTTAEDRPSLDLASFDRVRLWDSCFTLDFSYIHGGPVRSSVSARYRQWMTHKLASWHAQFGTGGCVGCGRCITWCPVGIDLTEEVRRFRDTDLRRIAVPVAGPFPVEGGPR